MIYVVNAVGTSDKKCPNEYDCWLDFWEKKTGKLATYCRNCGRSTRNLCGGHVQKLNSVVMVNGTEYRGYTLFLSVQNATILKTTKFFTLMKETW